MIVPVAVAQLVSRSFRGTMTLAMLIGAAVCVTGLSITYFHPLSPGATIVVLAIGVYVAVLVVRPLFRRHRHATDPHLDTEDDVELRQRA
jgi:zinc transport system permease protein